MFSQTQQREKTQKKILNFFLDPNQFAETIADCILDKKCHIFFRHIGKTGGTTIQYRMRAIEPHHHKSCCGERMMNTFESKNVSFCQANFSSYQINAHYFETVISECMQMNPDDERAIALMSFREPIQRCLSNIHQLCNKHPKKRTTEFLEACDRCSYDSDTDFWDKHIQKENKSYEGMYKTTKLDINNVQMMTIETSDIDVFF